MSLGIGALEARETTLILWEQQGGVSRAVGRELQVPGNQIVL